MAPKLEKVETVANDANRRLETLTTTVTLDKEDFKGFVKDVNAISDNVSELEDKLDGMTAALDINALLISAIPKA